MVRKALPVDGCGCPAVTCGPNHEIHHEADPRSPLRGKRGGEPIRASPLAGFWKILSGTPPSAPRQSPYGGYAQDELRNPNFDRVMLILVSLRVWVPDFL